MNTLGFIDCWGYHLQCPGRFFRTNPDHAGIVRHQGRFLYQRQMDGKAYWIIAAILFCGPAKACQARMGEAYKLFAHYGRL